LNTFSHNNDEGNQAVSSKVDSKVFGWDFIKPCVGPLVHLSTYLTASKTPKLKEVVLSAPGE
jgi:hypothetical protein